MKTLDELHVNRKDGWVSRLVKLKDIQQEQDREFDIAFWQEQTPAARWDAAFELVAFAQMVKNVPETERRFDRTIAVLKRT